jgi:hypothetical protein
METAFGEGLQSLQRLDASTLERLVTKKLRPPHTYFGLVALRERASRERDLRELYRGRAPYELLQNADDVGATRAAFVLTPDGVGFLHDGDWFTSGNFESLALGWSDKDPDVCIGNKGIGFRSVLDVTPSPHLFQVGSTGFFGVKFSYALNNGHIQETLTKNPELRSQVREWGPNKNICPVMSVPGLVRRQTMGTGAASILDYANRGGYGEGLSTLFWLPATDPEIPADVLRDLGAKPMTSSTSADMLRNFLMIEVSVLILFLRHIFDVRLYAGRDLIATVGIPSHTRTESGEFSVVTQADSKQHVRTFFQVATKVRIPPAVRNLPDTSQALRGLDSARVAVSAEIVDGRPVGDSVAPFHVYFPTQELTGLGFVVHGDFYVKPDRTRLMPSGYNEWLFGVAATLAAGPFLSGLLARKRARDVFAALRPMSAAVPGSLSAKFVDQFRSAIRERVEPFVPTSVGSRLPAQVVVPPHVDAAGDWDRFVGAPLAQTGDGRRFLLASEDSDEARAFLDIAGVQRLKAARFVSLVEAARQEVRTPAWWHGCYKLMAVDQEIAGWQRSDFVGRRVIPTSAASIASAPDDSSTTILVLPPLGLADVPQPPPALAKLLEFVDPEVAKLLWEGDVETRSWVTSRFRLSTFEVTDFLPRVLQAIAPQLYAGSGIPSVDELARIWEFVRDSIDAAARPITDEDVWQAVGRLPLPVAIPTNNAAPIAADALVPAFLAYLPDSWLEPWRALAGVPGLRRIAPDFLSLLEDTPRTPWRTVLDNAGVSSGPNLLRYRRIAQRPQVALAPQAPEPHHANFTGRPQQDENEAVLQLIEAEDLWRSLVSDAARCPRHPNHAVLSEVTVVEGLAPCVRTALVEHRREHGSSIGRLRQLTRELPTAYLNSANVVTFCQSCSHEGRAIGGAAVQLQRHQWVPSTFGPTTRDKAFLRMSGHRFIGVTPAGEELGDRLLPYVVADTIDHYNDLQTLGLEPLDDPGTARPTTLLRFLKNIGAVLSDDTDSEPVIGSRSLWRLVRGAIQESYVALNRADAVAVDDDLLLAVHTSDGTRFRGRPWYFAEPGSAVESAFSDYLSLIDTDRPYAKLFGQLGVLALVPGKTISEELVGAELSHPVERLRDQICQGLGRYLLALVVGRSDNPRHATLVARRLRDRFSVHAGPSFQLTFALADGSVRAQVPVTHFYLRRTVVGGETGLEASYTLHVVGSPDADLFTLDGDALGVALAPVFLEGLSDDLTGLFPRVVTRFQYAGGDQHAMHHAGCPGDRG